MVDIWGHQYQQSADFLLFITLIAHGNCLETHHARDTFDVQCLICQLLISGDPFRNP